MTKTPPKMSMIPPSISRNTPAESTVFPQYNPIKLPDVSTLPRIQSFLDEQCRVHGVTPRSKDYMQIPNQPDTL